MTVTHYQGHATVSRDGEYVGLARYYLEVWTAHTNAQETVIGTLEARPDLVPAGEMPAFALTLATGATLRCHLKPMSQQGTYEILALGEIEAPRP